MPPTLFHKLFNKRNASTPPLKCDKDESAPRYVWKLQSSRPYSEPHTEELQGFISKYMPGHT